MTVGRREGLNAPFTQLNIARELTNTYTMNYIKHLTAAFEKMAEDTKLNPTHVSLYVSLFQFWNLNRFQNPFSIARNEVMKVSKIASNKTYLKCLRELDNFGYIRYLPSRNPFKGSKVEICTLYTSATQALHRYNSKNDISPTQALPLSINSINYINNKTNSVCKPPPVSDLVKVTDTISNSDESQMVKKKEKVSRQAITEKRKKLNSQSEIPMNIGKRNDFQFRRDAGRNEDSPNEQEVLTFFQSQSFPTLEAKKFFNYYQSTGWKVGKTKPMCDWQAAARNWMLNAKNYNHEKHQRYHASNKATKTYNHLHINQDKDYGEPL